MVIVMRGISGAGKSTYVKKLQEWAVETFTVSADVFFIKNGHYTFDPKQLPQAHAQCLRTFIGLCMGYPDSIIVVDNTNTTVAEISPYMAVAAAYGHDAKIVTIECDLEVAAARNVHGVGLSGVTAQHKRLTENNTNLLPWWKHEIVKQ